MRVSKRVSHVDCHALHLTKRRSSLPRHRYLPCPLQLTALQAKGKLYAEGPILAGNTGSICGTPRDKGRMLTVGEQLGHSAQDELCQETTELVQRTTEHEEQQSCV